MRSLARRRAALAALLIAAGAAAARAQQPTPAEARRPDVADAEVFTPARYAVADFYGNKQFFGASWSPDRRSLLVSSNLSGVWNAYAVPTTGGPPRPLTQSTTNAVRAAGFFPEDNRIVYTSDEGGNELTHVYVRNTDGSVVDVTPGSGHKAEFAGWSGDRRAFYVSSNERDKKYFDLVQVSVDGLRRSSFYRNDAGYDLGPVSRDGRWVALAKPHTTSDADVYVYDRRKGATRHLTPHTGNVNNGAVTFTPDGAALLVISDSGSEFASLRRYDLATGASRVVYAPDWDVTSADYSRGGRYLVVYVNEDSRAAARILDARTLQPVPLPGMPAGVVRGVTVSPNDSAFAFYASDGSAPVDLYVAAFGQTPRRITDALSPKVSRRDLVVPAVTRFRSYDGVTVPGVLYRPHQASAAAKAPAIVMVHGGPGGQAQVGYSALVQALANAGYVVFDINNRGSSGYGKTFYAMDDRRHGEADLGDVVASKGMLAELGYVDTTRIGILGGSYGGYMTLAALTLQPDAFKAGVDLFGISNWMRTLESIPPWWESFKEALYAEMGDPKADSARLRRISPLFNAGRIRAPLMVLQGANDPRVLKIESDEIVEAARRNGVPVEYVVFPDEGHGFVKKANEIQGYTAVVTFLDRYLKGTPAAPPPRP